MDLIRSPGLSHVIQVVTHSQHFKKGYLTIFGIIGGYVVFLALIEPEDDPIYVVQRRKNPTRKSSGWFDVLFPSYWFSSRTSIKPKTPARIRTPKKILTSSGERIVSLYDVSSSNRIAAEIVVEDDDNESLASSTQDEPLSSGSDEITQVQHLRTSISLENASDGDQAPYIVKSTSDSSDLKSLEQTYQNAKIAQQKHEIDCLYKENALLRGQMNVSFIFCLTFISSMLTGRVQPQSRSGREPQISKTGARKTDQMHTSRAGQGRETEGDHSHIGGQIKSSLQASNREPIKRC